MQADEVLTQARDAMTVKRVFSEPYEKNGVTLITAAGIAGGAGAGRSGSRLRGRLRAERSAGGRLCHQR